MGVNAGALLGPFVCGWLAEKIGWYWGFGAAGVGMVVGLVIYLLFRGTYLPGIGVKAEGVEAAVAAGTHHAGADAQMLIHGAAGAVVGGALAWLIAGLAAYPMLIGAAIGAVMTITILGTHGAERRRVLAIYLAAIFVVFFWTAYEQAGSSMNLFADRHTDMVVLGRKLPASFVGAALMLVFVPLLKRLTSSVDGGKTAAGA